MVREMSAGSMPLTTTSSIARSNLWKTAKRDRSARLTASSGTTDSSVVKVRLPATCARRAVLAR